MGITTTRTGTIEWGALEAILPGNEQTPTKVGSDVAALLHSNKLKGSNVLLKFFHGLQSDKDAESILDTLVKGEAIEAPLVKKRGRRKKIKETADA